MRTKTQLELEKTYLQKEDDETYFVVNPINALDQYNAIENVIAILDKHHFTRRSLFCRMCGFLSIEKDTNLSIDVFPLCDYGIILKCRNASSINFTFSGGH